MVERDSRDLEVEKICEEERLDTLLFASLHGRLKERQAAQMPAKYDCVDGLFVAARDQLSEGVGVEVEFPDNIEISVG